MSRPAGTERAGEPARVVEDFLDLLCTDDELVRAEFDEIIAAAWPDRPDLPPRRRIGGNGRRHQPPSPRRWTGGGPPPQRWTGSTARRCQRSPPSRDAVLRRVGGR